MTKDELLELADRCEREEASLPLNEAIALTCGWETVLDAFRMPRWRMIGQSTWWAFEPALYTTSLDAAVTLVPEGWRLSLTDWSTDEEELQARARVFPWASGGYEWAWRHARTPALALCAAALRARASLTEKG